MKQGWSEVAPRLRRAVDCPSCGDRGAETCTKTYVFLYSLFALLRRSPDNHLELTASSLGKVFSFQSSCFTIHSPSVRTSLWALFLRWRRTNDDDQCPLLKTLKEKVWWARLWLQDGMLFQKCLQKHRWKTNLRSNMFKIHKKAKKMDWKEMSVNNNGDYSSAAGMGECKYVSLYLVFATLESWIL